MKNKKNMLVRFFGKTYNFFDKFLITPITKTFIRTFFFLKKQLKALDGVAGKKSTLIIISLLLAFVTFLVIDQDSNVMVDHYAETLPNQKVTAIYNEELYVVEGIPDTVDITLIGQKRHIFLAKQIPSQGITIDLTGYKAGNHNITLTYPQRLKSINYTLNPSNISISIYEKVSDNKPLTYDVLHKDNLNSRLSISNVKVDRSEVIVKGPQYKLNQVATVKALVDIADLPRQEEGDIKLDNVPLVAYDSNGKVVKVEIVPSTVTVTLSITSPHKTIPVNVIPKGDLAFGKAISSINTSIREVTVYGEQSAIDKIEQLDIPIDVKGLDKDKTYHVTLTKPNGITEIDVKTLDVKVSLDTTSTKEIPNVPVRIENLDSKYKALALTDNDRQVNVVVSGSNEALNTITIDNVKPYVNLKNYGVGEHEVEVKVSGTDNRLKYSSKTKKVKVRISQK